MSLPSDCIVCTRSLIVCLRLYSCAPFFPVREIAAQVVLRFYSHIQSLYIRVKILRSVPSIFFGLCFIFVVHALLCPLHTLSLWHAGFVFHTHTHTMLSECVFFCAHGSRWQMNFSQRWFVVWLWQQLADVRILRMLRSEWTGKKSLHWLHWQRISFLTRRIMHFV